jgi:hypothetical protein
VKIWTPPGTDLGNQDAPEPDSMMLNFARVNGPPHSGYHVLRAEAASWPVTESTPDGPASLLRTSRDLYAQGYYAYYFIAVAVVWSVFGVEAGLRARFGADCKRPLKSLVRQAEEEQLLPATGWEDERLDAGRELRNRLIHTGSQPGMPPAMARPMIAASHELVAALFPAPTTTSAK